MQRRDVVVPKLEHLCAGLHGGGDGGHGGVDALHRLLAAPPHAFAEVWAVAVHGHVSGKDKQERPNQAYALRGHIGDCLNLGLDPYKEAPRDTLRRGFYPVNTGLTPRGLKELPGRD